MPTHNPVPNIGDMLYNAITMGKRYIDRKIALADRAIVQIARSRLTYIYIFFFENTLDIQYFKGRLYPAFSVPLNDSKISY